MDNSTEQTNTQNDRASSTLAGPAIAIAVILFGGLAVAYGYLKIIAIGLGGWGG